MLGEEVQGFLLLFEKEVRLIKIWYGGILLLSKVSSNFTENGIRYVASKHPTLLGLRANMLPIQHNEAIYKYTHICCDD